MWQEFKAFISKGNVLDLAVGIIIGAAFGKIVSSAVSDVIMPVASLAVGKMDFTNLFLVLGEGRFATLADAKKAGVATLNYGLFLNNILDFLIIGFSVFMIVKFTQQMRKPSPSAVPTTKDCPYCLSQIPLAAKKCAHCCSPV